MRNILLIEPNYKNKYPPIGLMKISTYHRMLGDTVTFYKGDLKEFIVSNIYTESLSKLKKIDNSIAWEQKANILKAYIKNKNSHLLDQLNFRQSEFAPLIENLLINSANYFRKKEYEKNPIFDRIYVTTLFTFYWKITIDTIQFVKKLVKAPDQILIGGVMASLLTKEIELETGIKPISGLLDKPGELDNTPKAKNIIIDDLPLDYSILDEIDYEYPTKSAYFTFMTKGCTRKCSFCSVPKLEPTYKPKIETIDKFQKIKQLFGDQQNLLLMDNNVLASPNFPEIIKEIKDMGFTKEATFIEPNQLEIAVKNLKSNHNDKAYIRRIYKLLHEALKRVPAGKKQVFYNVLEKYSLLKIETVNKENLISAYDEVKEIYEKYRNKSPKLRYVDFNQGTDARYVTDELMRLMSEIPIRPLRIAFDYIGIKKQYIDAVKLAAKYGIKELSNYILYNFQDKPEDLYNRLKINIDLCRELNIAIFSFPMKYIPLFGEEAKTRDFTGKYWNKKFIRAIQSILNVTKGIVAPSHINEKTSFFEEAFGKDIDEFFEILFMPETYIIYRSLFRSKLGYTSIWKDEFRNLLNDEEREQAKQIIYTNDFSTVENITDNPKIIHFLRHYQIPRGSVSHEDLEFKQLKKQYDKLIKEDRFIDLTLTYDFESDMPVKRQTYSSALNFVKYDAVRPI
jgi:hypothetical protein